MAAGTVALVGAGEFLPAIGQVDAMLLARLPAAPRVVILPTASAPDGRPIFDRWAQRGVEHFTNLGATAEALPLLTRADAELPALAGRIAAAHLIYLSGGTPRYLVETLQNTAAWRAITSAHAAGAVVMGCSAGAMALAGTVIDFPHGWATSPALGLVPGLVVVPHFDEIPHLLAGLAGRFGGETVVGIDGSTALVGTAGAWQTLGIGTVTVLRGVERRVYHGGDRVAL
ncbi:MAG TPA: Type 1 glutamine amidotransferase-like domain-containing protein [Ktedonobacterales bacterium]|nr:Type 1 glutamine amidotransferase-like domain-containing protein [Ktedonobacterales bacterium]